MILNLCTLLVITCIAFSNGSANGGGVGRILLSNNNCSDESCYCIITRNVTDVLSGDTMNVEGLGIVKLVGIICPDISTQEGMRAKSYLQSLIQNKSICLEKSAVGNAPSGTTLAVAYLINTDGSVNTSMTINRMILYFGTAKVDPNIPEYVIDNIFVAHSDAVLA
jgi:endonuclease YncB( thermonuclease family)